MTQLHPFLLLSFFLSGNKDEAISMVSASAWDKRGGTWQRQKGRMGKRRRCISQKVICAVNWEVTISLHCKSFSIFSLASAYLSFLLWAVAVTCYTDRVYKQRWELASALSLTMGRETALHAVSPALCPGHFACMLHLCILLVDYTIPVYIYTQKVTKIYKWGLGLASLSHHSLFSTSSKRHDNMSDCNQLE